MKLIELKQLENGGHLNQTISELSTIPEGWAVIPEEMVCENFPFGEVTAEEKDGVMTVTNWIPGEIPVPEEIPTVDTEPTPGEILDTLLGVSE